MQFNSLAFVVFMTAVLPLYLALGRPRHLRLQNGLLLVASYAFYGYWDWRFLGLLALSTVVDYAIALMMTRSRERSGASRPPRWLLLASLGVNLGILGFFKYYNFFVASAAAALQGLGLEANLPLLKLVLPVGISFYTFQTIAYTYSVYKGEVPATRDFVAFAVYVAYFPQLVAGPIERASRLLPQIECPRQLSWRKASSGGQLVLQGLFKKIAIADAAAVYVEVVFDDPAAASSLTLLLGIYMFALQIYGDFSGYTDIARGVSRILGIELILNFRQPYLAASITDFWRRWHISLSTWLREHLYIPLGGNRRGMLITYRNLMLTMLLGGLWHGAGWTFVIWGGLHGVYLAGHRLWTARGAARSAARSAPPDHRAGAPTSLHQVAGILLTFHLVCFAWIFFRAKDLDTAWQVIAGLAAGDGSLSPLVPVSCMGLMLQMAIVDYACVRGARQVPLSPEAPLFGRSLIYGSAVALMILANTTGEVPFIYFQF
jgi:D-alanyl-lipoteichoic acid acyltransferase DltB (MBOAT superfamily)